MSAEASGSPTPGPPRPKRPSAGRLILESVAVALISVIVTKLVERVSGSEMSAAVLGGIAAGCVALLLGVRLKGRGAPPKAG